MKKSFIKIATVTAVTLTVFHSLAGNDGSGGGDSLPDVPIDKGGIEFILADEALRLRAEAMIYSFVSATQRGITYPYDLPEGEMQKRLEAKFRAYGIQRAVDLALNIEFDVKKDAPCIDPSNGQSVPRDAYADIEQNKICFSSQRLADYDYTYQSAESNLAALFLHELAHFVGANETEAQFLQETIQMFFSPNYINNLEITKINGISALLGLQWQLARSQLLGSEDPTEVCLGLGEFRNHVWSALSAVTGEQDGMDGLIIRPYGELEAVYGLQSLVWGASGYCLKNNRPDYDGTFGEQNFIIENGVIVDRVRHGDEQRFRDNLNRMPRVMEILLQNLRKSKLNGDCELVDDSNGNHIMCYKESKTLSEPIPLPPHKLKKKLVR
jgi:hypothetical protein